MFITQKNANSVFHPNFPIMTVFFNVSPLFLPKTPSKMPFCSFSYSASEPLIRPPSLPLSILKALYLNDRKLPHNMISTLDSQCPKVTIQILNFITIDNSSSRKLSVLINSCFYLPFYRPCLYFSIPPINYPLRLLYGHYPRSPE